MSFLLCLRGVAAGASVLYWVTAQNQAQGVWYPLTAVALLVVGALHGSRHAAVARASRYAMALATVAGLVSLYGGPALTPGFRASLVARSAFFLTSFYSLYHLSLLGSLRLERGLRQAAGWVSSHAGKLVYGLGLLASVLVATDSFFLEMPPAMVPTRPKYHPFLVYDRPESYAYANAKEKSVGDLWATRFSQQKAAGTLRIVLEGASTMWGHDQFARPQMSPQGQLRRLLSERLPERKIEVITLAFPGKYQLNELVDTVVTLPHWEPDLVVSWNGFNEIWYGEDENRYEGMPYTAGELEAALSTPFWLWGSAKVSKMAGFFYGLRIARWVSPYRLVDPAPYEPPRYYAYLDRTARFLADRGISYLHSFCPNAALKRRRTVEETAYVPAHVWKLVEERRAKSTAIVLQAGQQAYDAMAPLRDRDEALFVDPCHLNDRGVLLAMEDLADRIASWAASSRSQRAPKSDRSIAKPSSDP